MTRFDSIMGSLGRPLLQEQYGQTVTYLEPGEPDVVITSAILGAVAVGEREDGGGALLLERSRTLTIGIDDVAVPGTHATISIGGEIWSVISVESRSASLTTVRITRPATAEMTRKGIRRSG